jgi:hypothetical protein
MNNFGLCGTSKKIDAADVELSASGFSGAFQKRVILMAIYSRWIYAKYNC